jgi:hypothetical protein
MKRTVLLFAVALNLIGTLTAQSVYSDRLGDFTYAFPSDWSIRDYPGMKYKIAVGEVKDNFAQNINVVDEAFGGTMEEYVSATKGLLEQYFVEYKILKEESFANDEGLNSWKIVVENLQQKIRVRQYFYIFNKDGMFFVATCSVLSSETEEIEKKFDSIMKTFKILK